MELVEKLYQVMEKCHLCPQNCGINRLDGKKGKCRILNQPRIAASHLHFGEEPPLVGASGSGTIFFSGCNLKCVFCQNYDISQLDAGQDITVEQLANIMLSLQIQGALNINLVSPTHQIPQIIDAIILAKDRGLIIPIVYNSNGYDSVEILQQMKGIIDIYMPDIKYFDNDKATTYSDGNNYPEIIQNVLLEMHQQVGDLVLDRRGVAKKGLIIRHLVMPNSVEDSKKIIQFVAQKISQNSYLNIMNQYRPEYHAHRFHELKFPVYLPDYQEIIQHAAKFNLTRGLA